ncbi:MAG: hypothetical protein SVU32_09725, partial [Candidatus Nanohaloarchaea archaeon]|nr:hypothetical protein [Candidatus Nanohaloarchaea archaeon]
MDGTDTGSGDGRGFAERHLGPGRLAVTLPVYETDGVDEAVANLDQAYEAFDERIQEEDPREAAAAVARAASYDADGFYAWCDRRRFRGGYDGCLLQALANALPDEVVQIPRIDTVRLPDDARELNRYRMRYHAAREQDALDALDETFFEEKEELEERVTAAIRDQLDADVSADPSHISPWIMMGREIP